MKKMGLFWFAAALLGAALIFAGCETEADEKIVYLPGEMIRLDVLAANVTELKAALAETVDLAIGLTGTATLADDLEVGEGKAVYILNGGTLTTAASKALTVKGVVYVGIGGKLDVSAGNVVVDGGQVSVLPVKSIAGIAADVLPGTLVIASDTSVRDKEGGKVLGTGKLWIGGAVQYASSVALTDALINTAFTYVQPGGAVNVGTVSSVAATKTVTVPAGKSLNVAAALTIAAGAELVATGDVNVVVTDGSLVLAGTVGTAVAKISGAGNIVAGATTITGLWQLVGTAGSVAIAANSGTTSSITASGTSAVLTAGAGGLITQAAGAGNDLTINADTTIALGGVFATPVGTIVLTGDNTNPAKLTLIGTITGEAGTTAVVAGSIAITNATLAGTNAITGTTDAGTNNNLGSLIGSASNNTITAGSVSKDVTLKSSTTIK